MTISNTTWTEGELQKIIEGLGKNRIRFFIVLAMNTGCRIEELLELEYSNIQNNELYITRQRKNMAQLSQEEKEDGEKSDFDHQKEKAAHSCRKLSLNENVLHELELHKAWHQKEMVQNEYHTNFIFTTEKGNPYSQHSITRLCNDYYRSIGISNKTFHAYRHTFCENLKRQTL